MKRSRHNAESVAAETFVCVVIPAVLVSLGLALVLQGCAHNTPPCQPKSCPTWSAQQLAAKAELRKAFHCDTQPDGAARLDCDPRWRLVDDAMSAQTQHCVGVDAQK